MEEMTALEKEFIHKYRHLSEEDKKKLEELIESKMLNNDSNNSLHGVISRFKDL